MTKLNQVLLIFCVAALAMAVGFRLGYRSDFSREFEWISRAQADSQIALERGSFFGISYFDCTGAFPSLEWLIEADAGRAVPPVGPDGKGCLSTREKAATSGPNSPAITGNGNVVIEYGGKR